MRRLGVVWLVLTLGSLSVAQCQHPFYPAGEGWTWTYKNSVDGKTHTLSTSKVTPKGFVQSFKSDALAFETQWNCTAAGLMQPEFRSAPNSQVQMNFKTLKASGVVFPASMNLGATWSYSYDLEGSGKTAGRAMTLKTTQTTQSKVVGRESVKVAAGTFDAVKVESTITSRGTMSLAGQSVPMNTTIKSTSWYAQGVGLVRSVAEGITTELVSLKK